MKPPFKQTESNNQNQVHQPVTPTSRPIPIQQLFHHFSTLHLLFHFFNGPFPKRMSSWEVGVLEIRCPATNHVLECLAVHGVRVGFWVVLVDPTGKTGADQGRVLADGRPVGVVPDLDIDEGHFLGARNAVVAGR